MLTLFWILLWAGLAMLVIAAGLSLHVRRKDAIASTVPMVDDDAIERILATGELVVVDDDAPDLGLLLEQEALDPREIDDEEERFWSESWDEPTEW